jgi:hypothetical protein
MGMPDLMSNEGARDQSSLVLNDIIMIIEQKIV